MTVQAATITANRMPNITWHKLKINETEIGIPALEQAQEQSIHVSLPNDLQGSGDAFEQALQAAQGEDVWETGMGPAADEWLDHTASKHIVLAIPEGMEVADPVVVHINAQDGTAAVAAIDVVAGAGSSVHLAVHVDSPQEGRGVAGTRTRVFAGRGATVRIESVQTLTSTWKHLDNMGIYVDDGAQLNVAQTVLGAAQSCTGLAANLAGRESNAVVDTRYLGHGAAVIDFNYVIRQRGVQSTCNLTANGVLMDSSAKVLRGTIDLIHGAKGAVGSENETVLLVNDDVRNKTIPILLCDEDDVQGAHGATIGHVNPEQLRYLQTRGLTTEQVEALFASASFDYVAAHAIDDTVRNAVWRLGKSVIGEAYQLQDEEE